jgi:alpha-tubulin suppressor-like RCC1 family protein
MQSTNSYVFVCGSNQGGRIAAPNQTSQLRGIELLPSHYFNEEVIIHVESQGSSTLFITELGHVYLCGSFSVQMSDDCAIFNTPVLFKELEPFKIVSVATGSSHHVFLTDDNQVFTCGSNTYNELGDSRALKPNHSLKVFKESQYDFKKIVGLYCGSYFTVLRTIDHGLYLCGSNFHEQLGLGDVGKVGVLTLNNYFIENKLGIHNMDCGSNHMTVVTTTDRSIFVIGYNSEGQLGLGHTSKVSNFQRVSYFDGKHVDIVRCGFMSTVVLTRTGKVYGFGKPLYGHLGIEESNTTTPHLITLSSILEPIINIAVGNFFTVVQTQNEMYGFGHDNSDDFGASDQVGPNYLPKKIPLEEVYELRSRYHLQLSVYCGANSSFFVLNSK